MIRSRRQTAHTPIIFVTAFSDEMHTAQGYSLGAVDYILSPIVPEILRTKVGVFVDLYKKTLQGQKASRRARRTRTGRGRQSRRRGRKPPLGVPRRGQQRARAVARPAGNRARTGPPGGPVPGRPLHALPHERSRLRQRSIEQSPGSTPPTALQQSSPSSPTSPSTPCRRSSKRVLEQGAALLVPRPPNSPRSRYRRPRSSTPDAEPGARTQTPRDLGPCCVFAVPLKVRGQTFGALAIARRLPRRPFSPMTSRSLEDLAARAAVAVENARLYRHVQENDRRKNEFLAMLAHELRNPLAPIRSSVELLRMLELGDENLRLGERSHLPAGRPPGQTGRRSARHLAHQRGKDPASYRRRSTPGRSSNERSKRAGR